MVYTQEQLLKAVREAGRNGQPFSVGEVRAELGLKSRDKRELKRFRGRLRECCQTLGTNIEKLGPNTYRLKTAALPAKTASKRAELKVEPEQAARADAAARSALKQRVGITPRAAEPTQRTLAEPLAAAARVTEQLPRPAASESSGHSFGSRVSGWLSRVRGRNHNTASTALSRLAVDLQPNANHFQYQWVDGDLRVKLSGGLGRRQRVTDE